VKEKNRESSK